MRLRKVVNRVYEGTVYYRWVLSVPPRQVRELGWVDGQELETIPHGSSLWIQPATRARRSLPRRRSSTLEETVQSRSVARR